MLACEFKALLWFLGLEPPIQEPQNLQILTVFKLNFKLNNFLTKNSRNLNFHEVIFNLFYLLNNFWHNLSSNYEYTMIIFIFL